MHMRNASGGSFFACYNTYLLTDSARLMLLEMGPDHDLGLLGEPLLTSHGT